LPVCWLVGLYPLIRWLVTVAVGYCSCCYSCCPVTFGCTVTIVVVVGCWFVTLEQWAWRGRLAVGYYTHTDYVTVTTVVVRPLKEACTVG